MRLNRLAFIFAAVYFALIGGSVYYYQVFPIRALHHAVATLLLLIWLGQRLRRGLPVTPLNGVIAALIGVWFVTTLLSLEPRSAFENLWFPLTHVVLFFIIADLIGRGRESLVFETFFLVTALVALLALAQFVAWYTGIDLVPEPGGGWLNVGMIVPPEAPMLYIPLGVSTWLAGFAAPTLIVALGWAFSSTKRSYRIVFFSMAAALLVVLIGTFSRGGFVAAAAGVAALIGLRVIRSPGRSRRLFLWIIPAAALIAAVIGVVIMIGRSEARSTGDDLRFGLWNGALTIFADDPLTGVGAGLFGKAYREIRSPNYVDDRLSTAHNAYLNNAAETGLPGVIVMLAFALIVGWRWWHLWRRAESPARQRRLEAAGAGLIALALQSVFDTFLFTPLVLVSLVLIAYCVVEPGSLIMTAPSRANRLGAAALLFIMGAYGVAFIQIDRAHALFNRSARDNDLAAAQAARDLDPYLHLYDLQIAYLRGDAASYEYALTLEPTWDTGWINLGGLREAAGDIDGALAAFDRAMSIRYANAGAFNWARIADEVNVGAEIDILYRYQVATYWEIPLSDFWTQTERRRATLAAMMRDETYALIWRYQIAARRDPAYAETLVPEHPATGAEWWVVGEHALTVTGDPSAAARAFTEAIRLDRANGDYYVSRARAEAAFDPAAARRDLDTADMLTTRLESSNAVRALLAESADERTRYQAAAVPPRIVDQNFEGVLFQGRVASFQVLPALRMPGLGTGALQPWYDLAAVYAANGAPERANAVYRAILDVAPYEDRAAASLTEGSGE